MHPLPSIRSGPGSLLLPLLLTTQILAQAPKPTTVLFGTRAHETVRSGIAGSQSNPNNENGVINRYGVAVTAPARTTADAAELVNFGALVAYYGDTNRDGIHAENPDHGGAEAIDAVWVPAGLSSPPRWSDFYYSTGVDLQGGGGLFGVPITATEMVMIQPGGPVAKLYTEADLEVLLDVAPGALASANVDGFTKDPVSGDMYFSFAAQVVFNQGTAVAAPGDVVLVPGSSYVPFGPHGTVLVPIPGGARVAVAGSQLEAIATGLGVARPSGLFQLRDLDLDPAGGVFSGANGPVPNLLFVFDSLGSVAGPEAAAIYTTANGGGFAVVDGVAMRSPGALGLGNVAFNGLLCGSLDGLDVVPDSWSRLPLALDRFPNASGGTNPVSPVIVTPGPLEFGVAGIATHGPGAFVCLALGPGGVGTAAFRAPADPLGLRGSGLLQIAPGDPLFTWFALDPLYQSLTNNPVQPTPLGYGTFTVQIPIRVPVGFMIVAQAVDLADLVLSNANAVRF
jgi:hypothetical protein